jgi:hypothetical protein
LEEANEELEEANEELEDDNEELEDDNEELEEEPVVSSLSSPRPPPLSHCLKASWNQNG